MYLGRWGRTKLYATCLPTFAGFILLKYLPNARYAIQLAMIGPPPLPPATNEGLLLVLHFCADGMQQFYNRTHLWDAAHCSQPQIPACLDVLFHNQTAPAHSTVPLCLCSQLPFTHKKELSLCACLCVFFFISQRSERQPPPSVVTLRTAKPVHFCRVFALGMELCFTFVVASACF